MNYTPDNLPKEYRELFLRTIEKDPKYTILKRKLDEAVTRAKTTSWYALAVKSYEDEYLRKLLKYYHTDEAVDKEYNNCVKSICEITSSLDEDDFFKTIVAVNACIFMIDNFDTNLRTIDSLTKKACGNDYEIGQFDLVRESIATVSHVLKQIHAGKKEEYEYEFADEAERIGDYIEKRAATFIKKINRKERKKS